MDHGPSASDDDTLSLSSLLSILNSKEPGSSIASVVNATTIDLLCHLLYPEDYVSISTRLSDISDIANLLDFILHLLRNRLLSSPDASIDFNQRARRVSLQIISTSPVIPRSLIVTDLKVPIKRDHIGSGGFGGVFKGELRGAIVALKVLYRSDNNVAFCREAFTWAMLKHDFVHSFLGIYEEQDETFLVSPYMGNGTLAQWRKNANPSIAEIRERILEVAQGMEYIHSQGIVHGDLRGANVLLDDNLHVQITNFGLTRLSNTTDTESGAKRLNFSAPELFGRLEDADPSSANEPARTQMSDVYAFGCLYYEIHYDSIPFTDEQEGLIVALVIQGNRPSRLDDPPLSGGAWEVIQRCWEREPWKRQGMKDVIDSLVAMSPAKARNHEMLIKEPMPAPPLTSSNTGRGEDVEKGGAGVDGKKRTVKDEDGSILEEAKLTSISGEGEIETLSEAQIAGMSTEERTKKASEYKSKAESAYMGKDLARAVELYTRGIQVLPKADALFYWSRALCYINMSPPKHELVVKDCDEALKLEPMYAKALNRRAFALEKLERYEESLRDFTAISILVKFQNKIIARSVERVLKKLATKRTAELMAIRKPRLPSFNFIQAYFAAFRPRSHPTFPENPSQGDQTLKLALEALDTSDYSQALTHVNESLEQGISWPAGKAEALNLRGSFKFLTGDVDEAKDDLIASIALAPEFTQTLVKLASVYMEQGDRKKSFQCFDDAIGQNPNDPDIYYHRGQMLFIMNEFNEAAENHARSTKLDNKFMSSHIQLATAQHKGGNLAKGIAGFKKTLKAFPRRSEPYNCYGELLLDEHRFADAAEMFDKSFKLEKDKPFPNVLPLVNKGLTLFLWKQDIGAAERCYNEAFRIDPECEPAIEAVAQVNLRQGKLDKAVEMFDKQVQLARNEPELNNALMYKYAMEAQVEFQKNYPDQAAQLNQLTRVVL